jgi:hypothetical protein
MPFLTELGQVQLPVLTVLLLSGGITKVVRTIRVGSEDPGLGPTALFPMRLRRPVALSICTVELMLAVGLVVTAGQFGDDTPAALIRISTTLLFLVATSALFEMRTSKPEVGCGCFGDFSSAPVSGRTLVRSVLLAGAALGSVFAPPIRLPYSLTAIVELTIMIVVEMALIAALSPEIGEALVRFGYSEPCELKPVPIARTLSVLRRSRQWRRHLSVIVSQSPTDIWRELCWRYLVFPARVHGRPAEVVFAVYLHQRRPAIHVVLVDEPTGQVLGWPTPPSRPRPTARLPHRQRRWMGDAQFRQGDARFNTGGTLPFSSDI